jgi:hypothetical protein
MGLLIVERHTHATPVALLPGMLFLSVVSFSLHIDFASSAITAQLSGPATPLLLATLPPETSGICHVAVASTHMWLRGSSTTATADN